MDETEYRQTSQALRRKLSEGAPSPELPLLNKAVRDYEIAHSVGRVSSFPASVFLGMTDDCNARCRFCFYAHGSFKGYTVTPEDIERMDWLACVESFSLQGGLGEPFASPHIAENLRLMRERYPHLQITSATNASLLTDEIVDLLTGRMRTLTISLNATRKRTYEKSMPPLKWETTIGNIEKIRDLKVRRGTPLPSLTLSFVVHKDNVDELPELPALARELGADSLNLTHYSPQNRGGKYVYTDDYCLVYDPERYRAAYAAMAADCARLALPFDAPPPMTDAPYASSREFGFREAGDDDLHGCPLPWTWMINNHERETNVCCSGGLPSGHRPVFQPMGAEAFLDDFWNRDQFRFIRENVNRREPERITPLCLLCKTADRRDPRFKAKTVEAVTKSVEAFEAWRATNGRGA
jgi:hypothetical protein